MKHLTGTIAIALLVALAAGLGSAPAHAGATVLKDIPIAGSLDATDCCGEQIALTGIAHIVINNQGIHIKVSDVAGVGLTSGDDYVGVGASTQNNVSAGNANGASTSTFTFNIRMRSDDCGFVAKIVAHTTVNANGDVTSTFEFVNANCK